MEYIEIDRKYFIKQSINLPLLLVSNVEPICCCVLVFTRSYRKFQGDVDIFIILSKDVIGLEIAFKPIFKFILLFNFLLLFFFSIQFQKTKKIFYSLALFTKLKEKTVVNRKLHFR